MAGDYRLLRVLGHGGMGVVYEAEHRDLNQRAAVKIMRIHNASEPAGRAQLLEEGRLAAKVQHTGIVQIYQVGEFDHDHLYFLMEIVTGGSLRQWLRARPASATNWLDGIAILAQVAAAMATAHAGGVVHCDLKPENILLANEPLLPGGLRAKVADFGIARQLQGSEGLRTRGTIAYMSPEQCLGNLSLDGQSDVYSLGCVLYEVLAGRKVFPDEERAAIIAAHLKTDPQPLSHVRPLVPAELDRLVLAMLQKRPGQRPTMAAVATSLKSFLHRKEGRAGRSPQGWRWSIALLVALSLVAATWLWQRRRGASGDMVLLPGGVFQMGMSSDEQAELLREIGERKLPEEGLYREMEFLKREGPAHAVQLSPFFLDRREVSCAEYADWLKRSSENRMLQVGSYVDKANESAPHFFLQETPIFNLSDKHPSPCITWDGRSVQVVSGRAEHPVTAVTWEGAALYCQAQGKRLPTEAEWEYAAGGQERRRFPWGDAWPTCEQTLVARSQRWNTCGLGGLLPRGSMPGDRTAQGIHDLGGSVSEWVADVYSPTFDLLLEGTSGQTPSLAVNPLHVGRIRNGEVVRRVIRGGSWSVELSSARATARGSARHDSTDAYLGFRCARSQP